MAGRKRKAPPAPAPVNASFIVIAPQGLNLRAGPGRGFPVLKVLKPGAALLQAGDETLDGWLPVAGGWVDAQYVKNTEE